MVILIKFFYLPVSSLADGYATGSGTLLQPAPTASTMSFCLIYLTQTLLTAMTEPTSFTEISALAWPLPSNSANVPLSDLEQMLASTLLTTQFAYVYDHVAQHLVFVSAGVTLLVGECPDVADLTPEWFRERLHPADAPTVLEAQTLVSQYLAARQSAPLPDFLFSIDYRLRHANGHYHRVLHEHLLLERAPGPGAVRQSLHLFTDITPHKLTHEVRCHVNQLDFAAFAAQQQLAFPTLSAREQQILGLVLRGLTSRQIAYHLNLCESSVKSHRRNIARKTATHSFHQLLAHIVPASGNLLAGTRS